MWYNQNMRLITILVLVFCIFFAHKLEARTIFTPPASYGLGNHIRVLIVPGHDDENSGAVYKEVREEDMTLMLAKEVESILEMNPQISADLTRRDEGYIIELQEYFEEEKNEIEDFIQEHIEETEEMIEDGEIEVGEQVTHNDAPNDVAFRLYAINKWAKEEKYDFVVHLHYNDAVPRKVDEVGEFSGYSVYIPDGYLLNAEVSRPLGEAISRNLSKSIYASNNPVESKYALDDGVIEDFKLIAVGSNRTLTLPSILVEYSYISEPILYGKSESMMRSMLAHATSNGINEYLMGVPNTSKNLSYVFTEKLQYKQKDTLDITALQFALSELGFYPPVGKTEVDCPVTEYFGPCTKGAVMAFQTSRGLVSDGIVGVKTRDMLNYEFGR